MEIHKETLERHLIKYQGRNGICMYDEAVKSRAG